MTVKLINRGEVGEYLLDGRLDSNSAPEVEKILLGSYERFEKVIINLERTQYISSAGLRIFRLLHMDARKKDLRVVFTNVAPAVMEVFEMTGFAQLLSFE